MTVYVATQLIYRNNVNIPFNYLLCHSKATQYYLNILFFNTIIKKFYRHA